LHNLVLICRMSLKVQDLIRRVRHQQGILCPLESHCLRHLLFHRTLSLKITTASRCTLRSMVRIILDHLVCRMRPDVLMSRLHLPSTTKDIRSHLPLVKVQSSTHRDLLRFSRIGYNDLNANKKLYEMYDAMRYWTPFQTLSSPFSSTLLSCFLRTLLTSFALASFPAPSDFFNLRYLIPIPSPPPTSPSAPFYLPLSLTYLDTRRPTTTMQQRMVAPLRHTPSNEQPGTIGPPRFVVPRKFSRSSSLTKNRNTPLAGQLFPSWDVFLRSRL
jgi:hypothetical protein